MQKQIILITQSTFCVLYQFIDYNKINLNSSHKKTKQNKTNAERICVWSMRCWTMVLKNVNVISKWYYCSTVINKFMLEWSLHVCAYVCVKNKCFNACVTSLVCMRLCRRLSTELIIIYSFMANKQILFKRVSFNWPIHWENCEHSFSVR